MTTIYTAKTLPIERNETVNVYTVCMKAAVPHHTAQEDQSSGARSAANGTHHVPAAAATSSADAGTRKRLRTTTKEGENHAIFPR